MADMVRQFADPHAFIRELVQNSIDAGATAIEIHLSYAGGAAAVAVHDDGSGMTRAIIEGPLLTLFSSAKDGDASKIGKYGVGFVSVLALEPDEVVVETWCGDEDHRLRIGLDHAYELAECDQPRATPTGTIVSLDKTMAADDYDDLVVALRAAARRWCRHAHLPITLVAHAGDGVTRERIDEPLAVDTAFVLRAATGTTRIVAGPAPIVTLGDELAGPSFGGFYNRGLTLHETESLPAGWLGPIRFKIDCPSLQHTLSRDNVRRDDAYRRVIGLLEELGRRIDDELAKRLREAAGRSETDPVAYQRLLAAAVGRLQPEKTWLALTDAVAGKSLMPLEELAHIGLYAPTSTPLTRCLARAGIPTVLAVVEALPSALARAVDRPFELVSDSFRLVVVKNAKSDSDKALLAGLREHLDAVGRLPPSLRFAHAGDERAAIHDDDDISMGRYRALRRGAPRRWTTRLTVRPMLLSLDHDAVRAARKLAKRDPAAAALLLATYLLYEEAGTPSRGQRRDLATLAARAVATEERG